MTIIIIYPNNEGCIDGTFCHPSDEFLSKFHIKKFRQSDMDYEDEYDGYRIIAFAQNRQREYQGQSKRHNQYATHNGG